MTKEVLTAQDGTALTAEFFRACGREVEQPDNDRPRPDVPECEHGIWVEADCVKCQPPDWTPDSHLGDVVGLVRERWPEWKLFEQGGAVLAQIQGRRVWGSETNNPGEALMRAAIQAGTDQETATGPGLPVETRWNADSSGGGCTLAGPGRGDCEHFCRLPATEDFPEDVDEYGKPRDWCWSCWKGELLQRCQTRLTALGETP